MAEESYKFSGQSGLFFEGLYSSQAIENKLEKAMAQVCPCLFYFDGKCKIKADTYGSEEEAKNPGEDLKTPCVGVRIRCPYYTSKFDYLTKEHVKDGRAVLAEHIIELFKAYLKYPCSYEVVNTFAHEVGISSYWGVDTDPANNVVVLPKRITIDTEDEILSLTYSPTSLEYGDYLTFVTDEYFKLLFPRMFYPLNITNEIYQGDRVSVLLDVPGDGYTYIIYISELGLSTDILAVIDDFFKTGATVKRDSSGNVLKNDNNVQNLAYFFKEVFKKLREKQDNNLILVCDKVGFGISLATLLSTYDLSKCLIIYSESKLFFHDDLFDLSKIFIGMIAIDKVYGMKFDMSYCDVNFASNCIYDLATSYTLDTSYTSDNPLTEPIIQGDYKGQDLLFGASVSIVSKQNDVDPDVDEKKINMTALPLPWYYSDETTKKYLWSLKKEEKIYKIEIDRNKFETVFDLGKIIIFKNMIIACIKDVTFPFYIKDCTYNSYKYKTKYQSYHPMLEYDISSGFSFLLEQPDVLFQETETTQQPNPNMGYESEDETQTTISEAILLKSFPPGVIVLVPDIEDYIKKFDDVVELKFTFVKGSKIEYFTDVSKCEDKDLFIPSECSELEQFKLESLANDKTYEEIVKVELEEDEESEDATVISLSNLVEGQSKQAYYVEVTCKLEVDEEAGVTYKQADIKSVSYFYFSYLSFKFLFDSISGETVVVEEEESNEGNKIITRIERKKEKNDKEVFDPENSDVQKFLRGERPLLTVNDLSMLQEVVEGEEEEGQEAYAFTYLYENTVRSYINNKFYEPFSIDFLCGKENNPWMLLFTNSVSDFYILKQLEEAKEIKEPNAPEPPTEVKHNLTHVLDAHKFFGLSMCGFNKDKLKLSNKYPCDSEESIFDKLVMDNFEHEFNKVFYFCILGISKFIQDYIFFIKYKESVIPILKRVPVIVSQVGLPDPEIKYKWKSKCSIYTYSYDTGLNPFTKVVDSENLNFFINPFYVIVHKDYRSNKYNSYATSEIEESRVATSDYGFLFTSNWWIKYKQKMDTYGYVSIRGGNIPNIFLNVYKTLANIGNEEVTRENIISGFAKGKDILYIELESIDYIYSSYCGDHDFSLGNTTPYLYDRASDFPLSTTFIEPTANRVLSGIYYTGDYDREGVNMRRARPCSRFVGPMWFPFRACEVVRYNEFADYPEVRQFIDEQDLVYNRLLRGFSCTDLIFKPYNTADTQFSDFKYLFVDDCFGSINPYRYSSSFYSIDTLHYYEAGDFTDTFEIAPTYLASNASIPWRFTPIIFKDGTDDDHIVVVKPREYIIGPVVSGTMGEIEGVEKCVILDVSDYKDFKVGETNITVTKSTQPESGVTRSILYNCLIDTPPMLPYNYNKDKYICGYERMRGGDANFIYQCLYPYHHSYNYLKGCKCAFDYKNKGEEAYGPIKNTLLPSVINMGTDSEMIISNSVFFPGISCKGSNFLPCFIGNQLPLFAYDWLNRDVPYVNIGCYIAAPYNPIAERHGFPWVEASYKFWSNYDTLGCGTDGPIIMKICLNHYHYSGSGSEVDFIGSIFIDKNSDCCDNDFVMDSEHYNATNLTSENLYYHFASAWKQAYDYILLGASMESKPIFYGDGSFRVFKEYKKLKEQYYIFDEDNEVNNVGALPVFGGLGKFFRTCYFSTYYGKVPFSTLSGINSDPGLKDDANYVYKLSGYVDNDIIFNNDFEYGYLPEKDLVVMLDDISLFTSMTSFTEDEAVTLETRDCVRFGDLVLYEEAESDEEESYYKYKGGDDITIVAFGDEGPVESGPAFVIMYDKSVLTGDKYSYYGEFGLHISIAKPIFGDMGVVVDPFPFGEKVKIECEPLIYDQGYLLYDIVKLRMIGLGCCPITTSPCLMEIKVKEGGSGASVPWKFYIESEETIINSDGETETKEIEVQQAYLCYDNVYKVGKLVQRDDNDEMSLSDHDVIKKGDVKYKINRGFYIDFKDMFLPYSTDDTSCWLQNLNTSYFSAGESWASSHDCFCVVPGVETALYINLSNSCFIISLEGSFFSSRKWTELTIVGYLCLETSEEFYAVGNLIANPKYDSAGNNIKINGKYRYGLEFEAYSNYNKVKYCGTKYKLVFNAVFFFCDGYNDRSVDIKYGRFDGGTLCEITFNKLSSLKAVTYSKSIKETVQGTTQGIDLYHENLNDKVMSVDLNDSFFYVMPFGFVHKLKGGILEDRKIEFKEGYDDEFAGQVQNVSYSEDEQIFLDRITLPVEKDIYELIHYPTCFVRFCLKSKLRDISSETDIILDTGLVPDLCNIFGYVPIPQWVAPGHKLDLYPDSFYGGYVPAHGCSYAYLIKAFSCTSCLDIYKNDLDVLAKASYDERECNCNELLGWCGLSTSCRHARGCYFVVPYNVLFITHVDHGMFGYPDIVDVSDWIKEPAKSIAYEIYDENGELIPKE